MKHAYLDTLIKYLLCCLLTLCLCASPPLHVPAAADESSSTQRIPTPGAYACVLAKDTFFYSAADERKGIFSLPQTYFVRLIEYGYDYCKVEYQRNENDAKRIVGYARTEQLTFVDFVPLHPYLYHVFDVTYTIGDTATDNSSFLTEITLSCVYYGDYRMGSETYCYVLRGEEFGYIPKPTGLNFDRNTEYEEYLNSLTPPEEDSSAPAEVSNASPIQVTILVVICLLVPVLAAFILKPPKKPSYQFDE